MSAVFPLKVEPPKSRYDFDGLLRERKIELPPLSIETLQVNITKTCNQACRHCHVDASPARTESMSRAGIEKIVAILAAHPQIAKLDITGGAPELHPDFDWLVERTAALGRLPMVRHNLTVQFDGHPQTGASKEYLPAFFARHRCEVISSLPYYQEFFTDSQRGKGVFDKSLRALRRLNEQGYGVAGTGLALNLVYNPVGPYLPAAQATLEADYKRELKDKFGIVFNGLFTITNMPINRFRLHLEKSGQYEAYMEKLLAAFNPAAASGVMCRSLVSVGWDGTLYDCDFNQMLEMDVRSAQGGRATIFDFDFDALLARRIRFDGHCLGCTAGAGSKLWRGNGMIRVAALLLLLLAGCGTKVAAPTVEESRAAVAAYVERYGELLEFTAGPGLPVRHMTKGYTVLAVPVRGALRLNKNVYWSEMKSITVQVEEYLVPAVLKRHEDLQEPTRNALAEGVAINGLTRIPAGATYVFDGKVLYRRDEQRHSFDEWVEKHRGYCEDEGPAACYAKHQVEDPIRR